MSTTRYQILNPYSYLDSCIFLMKLGDKRAKNDSATPRKDISSGLFVVGNLLDNLVLN